MTPPREQLLRRQPVPSRDLLHHGPRRQRLLDEPRLVVSRELPATAVPRDHLDPTNRGLRLKHMVKLRHKPISDSEIDSSIVQSLRERWSPNSVYDSADN